MPASALPFDDIRALFATMPKAAETCVADVRLRERELDKPAGSLGRLEDIVEWLAAWQGKSRPTIERPQVVIFAASHGVASHELFPPRATARQMMESFSSGGAAINQICGTFGLGLKVFDLALDIPTGDIAQTAALDEKSAAATFAFGMEAIADGTDLLCLGGVGAGDTTVAAAIYYALYGGTAADWVAREATTGDAHSAREIAIVASAVALHRDHLADPLEIMRRLGGREIAAIAGAIMAARMERTPVILDGYVVTAAAAILHALDPHGLDHCLAGQVAAEGAHAEVLRRLGLKPLLDLGIQSGDGCGAALAAGLAKAALACHRDMAPALSA